MTVRLYEQRHTDPEHCFQLEQAILRLEQTLFGYGTASDPRSIDELQMEIWRLQEKAGEGEGSFPRL